METIKPKNIKNLEELKAFCLNLSKTTKGYITAWVNFGEVTVFVYQKKPSNLDQYGVDYAIEFFGGFYKNGEIVQPANSIMARYRFCPCEG